MVEKILHTKRVPKKRNKEG